MIRWYLKELIGRYESETGKSISYRKISEETEVALSSISDIATGKSTRVDLQTLDTLTEYFSGLFGREVSICDLLKKTELPKPKEPTP